MKSECVYAGLSPEIMLKHLQVDFQKLLDNFRNFLFDRAGTKGSIGHSIPLIYEIYKRIDQRRDYYAYFHSKPGELMKMSEAKEVALMAYWVIKYKPLSLSQLHADDLYEMKSCTINEYFAAFCIFSLAKSSSSRKDINAYFSPKNIDNLVYTFMHRDISKEAMICYVESLMNVA